MARKSRRRRKKKEELKLKLTDYQFPGEKNGYWTAIGITLGLFIWAGVMAFVFRASLFGEKQWSGLGGIGWPIWATVVIVVFPWLAILAANILATRHSAADIKQVGRQAKVMPNNYPELHRVLADHVKLAGMKLPNMYLLQDEAPYIYTIPGGPGTIVVSTGLRDDLEEDDLSALIAHEIGHINSHHVRTTLAINYITNANPIFKVLLFPLLMIKLFAGGWMDLANFTADRFAVLLTGDAAGLNKALVKMAVLADKQADITPEELRTYLESSSDISTDAAQMERQFRIGTFISSQPNLGERIEEMREFIKSDEGKTAFEKMDEIRRQAGAAQPASG